MNRLCLLALVLAACGSNPPPMPDAPPPATRAVVVAPPANLGPPPGVLSALDIKTLVVDQNLGAQIVGADPVIQLTDGKLYITNRSDGNNVTIVDATTLNYVDQIATGPGSNAQDAAIIGNKIYIPALGSTGVIVAMPGSSTFTTIDLGTAAGDPDGKPDCTSAIAVGTDVYVACDLLDSTLSARGPGKIVVIDSTTDTVRTTITLPFANPQNQFVRTPATSAFGGDLLIQLVPGFTDYSTGCIARITTGATPTATCAIQNSALNGFAAHMALSHDGASLWVAISNFNATTFDQTGTLRSYAIASSQLSAPVSTAAQFITDVATCPDGSVVVADRTGAGGLRVFKDSVEVTSAELAVGLPPGFGNGIVCY